MVDGKLKKILLEEFACISAEVYCGVISGYFYGCSLQTLSFFVVG